MRTDSPLKLWMTSFRGAQKELLCSMFWLLFSESGCSASKGYPHISIIRWFVHYILRFLESEINGNLISLTSNPVHYLFTRHTWMQSVPFMDFFSFLEPINHHIHLPSLHANEAGWTFFKTSPSVINRRMSYRLGTAKKQPVIMVLNNIQ